MNPFQGMSGGITAPATNHFAIVPNDGADLPQIPRAIYVQAAGNLVLRDAAGVTITYAVTAGQVLDFRAVRVMATGTTAIAIGWF